MSRRIPDTSTAEDSLCLSKDSVTPEAQLRVALERRM
jgi:hypothetical protein